jgi:hypothetical protein
MRTLSLIVLLVTAGCSGTGAGNLYAPLFDAPTTAATPDEVTGLWGGSLEQGSVRFDTRFKFEAGKTTVATKCTYKDGTVLSAGAVATSRTAEKTGATCLGFVGAEKATHCGTVEILETKADRAVAGDKVCSVNLRPLSTTWSIAGTKMRYEMDADWVDLVKISD